MGQRNQRGLQNKNPLMVDLVWALNAIPTPDSAGRQHLHEHSWTAKKPSSLGCSFPVQETTHHHARLMSVVLVFVGRNAPRLKGDVA